MAQNDRIATDDVRALETLDVHYGMLLGSTASDLRRPGWLLLTPRIDFDPMELLFGQRALINLVAPIASGAMPTTPALPALRGAPIAADPRLGRAGVAVVAPSLRAPLADLLRDVTPGQLVTPRGLRALDDIVRREEPDCLTTPDEAHLHLRYVSRASFRPYIGQWQEFIEPLDDGSESEPLALGLLARYSGGIYVIRERGHIASFAGIRSQSPHVSEIGVRTDNIPLRGHGLARAVVSRATRAVFAAERLPLYRHHATNLASRHVADHLGYRLYAHALTYFAAS